MSITKQPEWLNNAVFYEIYPQSFNDTNADGIGDFNGIIEKLDYIRELGCNAIWINPCFKSPFGDAGYDVEDYYTAAPRYGTNEDLARVFSEAGRLLADDAMRSEMEKNIRALAVADSADRVADEILKVVKRSE